jgi:hypothetical protein
MLAVVDEETKKTKIEKPIEGGEEGGEGAAKKGEALPSQRRDHHSKRRFVRDVVRLGATLYGSGEGEDKRHRYAVHD